MQGSEADQEACWQSILRAAKTVMRTTTSVKTFRLQHPSDGGSVLLFSSPLPVEYHKIETLFDRDEHFRVTDKLRNPVYGAFKTWHVTEKIDGCQGGHRYDERWAFNGDREKPTFRASLLIPHHDSPEGYKPILRCHSFVTDGKIEFLGDSEHELKGQTVELPDF